MFGTIVYLQYAIFKFEGMCGFIICHTELFSFFLTFMCIKQNDVTALWLALLFCLGNIYKINFSFLLAYSTVCSLD